jgi:LPXTG-motif cell wall-anchored protein
MMKKMLTFSVAAGFALATLVANAQSANDNATPLNSPGISLSGPFSPYGGGFTCPDGPVASSLSGATTQMGRIFRDGIASTCPGKAYPGIFNATTVYNYETFTYSNTDAAPSCVTVNFDPDTVGASPCATNAHMSAYLGSYDPANQGTNFLGDVGSSVAQPFSFEVPGNSQLVLAVTNTSAAAVCDFGFEVVNLPCVAGEPFVEGIELPSQGKLSMLIMGLLLAGAGWLVVRRRRA